MAWDEIPKIQDGVTTFSAQDLNPIINGLAERTNILKDQIISDSVLNGVGFTDIGLSGCSKGQFVAYSSETKGYVPASAKWDSMSNVPPGEACVVGVVISEIIDGAGTILVSGIIRNADLISLIAGSSNPPAGEYYLTTAGKITSNTSSIEVPVHCGTLLSTGCFVLGLQVPDFRTHTHTKYAMNSKLWQRIGTEECSWRYDGSKDSNLSEVFEALAGSMALVVNNKVLLEGSDYEVNNGIISIKGSFTETPISSVMFGTNPFVNIIPWVTEVRAAENSLISVAHIGTTAVVNITFPVENIIQNTGKAVTAITQNGLRLGNVINEIQAGPGIIVEEVKEGKVQLSSTSALERYIEMNVMNGSGIVYGGESDACCIKFPAGRVSRLAGTVRAPNDGETFKAKVFAYVDSSDVSALEANINVLSAPTESGIASSSYNMSLGASVSGAITLCETGEFAATTNALISIDICAANPGSTISLRSCGVVFTAEITE